MKSKQINRSVKVNKTRLIEPTSVKSFVVKAGDISPGPPLCYRIVFIDYDLRLGFSRLLASRLRYAGLLPASFIVYRDRISLLATVSRLIHQCWGP